MHSAAAATLLLVMAGVLAAPIWCQVAPPAPTDELHDLPDVYIGPAGEIVVRPDRPKNFISADDLKGYLENLRSYYAMMGRPRFGKRGPMISFQRHTVAAEKTRKVQQVAFPEDDYGDPLPFRTSSAADHRRHQA